MEEKELKEALRVHGEQILAKQAELEKAIGDKSKELKAEIDAMESKRAEMQNQMDALDIELQKSKHTPNADTKSFAESLKDQLTKEAAKLKGMNEKNVQALQIEIKSFLESANASVTTGSLLPVPQFEVGVSKAPDRMPFVLDIIAKGIANSLTIYWTQRKTRTDNSGYVTEGTLTTLAGGTVAQSVLGYETKSASMQNLSAFIKVSNNSIDDIDWLLSEVQTELVTLMVLKLDADLLNGTEAVNGFDGINTLATAFNAGGVTLEVGVKANEYDCLMFAATQIKKANFTPNYVLLNPTDVLKMKLNRDGEGGYLWPPYMAVNPAVSGIQILENNGVTAGSYLVGDFSKAKFWTRKGMELKIWEQNENDVLTMLKTVTLYMRGTLVVKDADKLAFVKDTFADSKVEITAV